MDNYEEMAKELEAMRPAGSLDELAAQQIRLAKLVARSFFMLSRIVTAMIGEWNIDGTYSDGWIQRETRSRKILVWLASVATSLLTGILGLLATYLFTHTKGH